MKKLIVKILALSLAVSLLCGCAETGGLSSTTVKNSSSARSGVKFDDIEYVRPDLEELRRAIDAVEEALEDGSGINKIMSRLDTCYELYYSFDSMYSVADIRACLDVTDEYYAREYGWCEKSYSTVRQMMEELLFACGGSEKAQKLEKEYFWEGFAQEYADKNDSVYLDERVELMQRESELLSRYRAIISNPTVTVNGEKISYYDYVADLYADAYRDAAVSYYELYNGDISDIYIELVKVRRELAAEMGYDSYEQMQYDYYYERDYSVEEAAGYIADIKEHLVPFYEQVMAGDPYSSVYYDYLTDYQLRKTLETAVKSLGGAAKEAFDFMVKYGYYDISVSTVKADMSFQTYIEDYDAPYLFLNPCGDTEDILSFSHEFGHYLDAYYNYDAYETVDVAESFSQGMEYLLLTRYDEVMNGDELENIYMLKMLDTLELYAQQASFAEFETVVYSTDEEELSAEFLNELSLRLAIEYGYYDGVSSDYYAMSWIDISHFFEQPFYIISYVVSNDIAMQVYELEQQQEGLGFEKYMEMLPRQYEGIVETAVNAGLESPFTEGRVEKVTQDLRRLLRLAQTA